MYTTIGFWFGVPTIVFKSGSLTVKFPFVLSATTILWLVNVNGVFVVFTVAVSGVVAFNTLPIAVLTDEE